MNQPDPADEKLPFTAPADGLYQIEGKTYRLGQGTVVNESLVPTLDPYRGCICSLGPAGSNPACGAHRA